MGMGTNSRAKGIKGWRREVALAGSRGLEGGKTHWNRGEHTASLNPESYFANYDENRRFI